MSKMFLGLEEAAEALGVTVEVLEEMFALGELPEVKVGTQRRLVRVRDVEDVLERVRSGGRLRTKREFSAATIPGAVEKAAGALGIDPKRISYRVLARGDFGTPGSAPKEARIAVDLLEDAPEDAPPSPPEEGRVPRATAPRPQNGVPAEGRAFYTPEQAGRLMGLSPHEVNLRIYRRELPTANINGYRWVPKEALDEKLEELSPPEIPDPPRPFLMLDVPPAEDAALGTKEMKDLPPVEELLSARVVELEEQVEDLKHELRLEKARRVRDPEGDRVA